MERFPMIDVDKGYSIEVENDLYVARFVGERMSWGLGNIEAPDYDEAEKAEMARVALDSMVTIDTDELLFSGCTDGRLRLHLGDGSAAPVREKLVGADTVTAFHMAETVGEEFYGDLVDAPVKDRVNFVIRFLIANGLMPSTHGPSCGAAAGYPTILENAVNLSEKPEFTHRQGLLLPQYDREIQKKNVEGYKRRLEAGRYDGWSESIIREGVINTTGQRGVKDLLDDGKGVHGHTEKLIARIKPRGVTIGATLFAARMGGNEVFIVNDARQEYLAQLFSRGDTNSPDFLAAINGSEDFQDAGHATLSSNLETLVIEQKTA